MRATLLHPTKKALNQHVELGEIDGFPAVIICGGQVFTRGTTIVDADGNPTSARYTQVTFVYLDAAARKVG